MALLPFLVVLILEMNIHGPAPGVMPGGILESKLKTCMSVWNWRGFFGVTGFCGIFVFWGHCPAVACGRLSHCITGYFPMKGGCGAISFDRNISMRWRGPSFAFGLPIRILSLIASSVGPSRGRAKGEWTSGF